MKLKTALVNLLIAVRRDFFLTKEKTGRKSFKSIKPIPTTGWLDKFFKKKKKNTLKPLKSLPVNFELFLK